MLLGWFAASLAQAVKDGLISSVEAKLIKASNEDHATRDVYADWLEGCGQTIKSEFVRLHAKWRQDLLTAQGHLQPYPPPARLLALAPATPARWRRLLGFPVYENGLATHPQFYEGPNGSHRSRTDVSPNNRLSAKLVQLAPTLAKIQITDEE